MASMYEVFRIPALDGGMVTSVSPRLLNQEQGLAAMVKNLDLTMPGVPKKRPACVEEQSTPEPPTGVHEYINLPLDKLYMLISYGEVIAYEEDGTWHTLQAGLTDGIPMEFITMANQAVMTNGVDEAMAWDGESDVVVGLGAENASVRTYLLYSDNDLDYTAKEAGEDGNNILIQYDRTPEEGAPLSVEVSGAGTEEDPYLIKVLFEWEDTEDEGEQALSTGQDVKDAVEADASADALVDVDHATGSSGEGKVMVMPQRRLSGGYNAVKGHFLTEYRLRAVMAGENKIRLSHTGDPHLWSPYKAASNAMEAYVSPDDGEYISGLLSMGEYGVLIGKPSALYGLFGYKRENFVIEQMHRSIGVSSHRSMAFVSPHAYWVWEDGIYRMEMGGVPERISTAIEDFFLSQVDRSRLDEATAIIYEHSYVVSLPKVDGGFLVLCWNIEREKWGLWTNPKGITGSTQTTEDRHRVYFTQQGLSRVSRFTLEEKEDFGEEVIEAEIMSLELDTGLPEVDKDINELYLVFRGTGMEDQIDIEVYLDGESRPSVSLLETLIRGAQGKQTVLRVPVGRTARFMEVKIADSDPQEFTPLSLFYTYQLKEVL